MICIPAVGGTTQEVFSTILKADQEIKVEQTEELTDTVSDPSKATSRLLGKRTTKMMTDEERKTGSIDFRVYWAWSKAAGGVFAIVFNVLALTLERFFYVSADYWLAIWTSGVLWL
jgi:hypothetical protein